MKYIQKRKEPASFRKWKGTKPRHYEQDWDSLDSNVVRDIRSSLLKEQGYICCYCGKRVESDHCPIEHLKPQKKFPDLKFKYDNLLGSCDGGETRKERGVKRRSRDRLKNLHCAPRKGDWYDKDLMVSPLDLSCESYFRFTPIGEIYPTDAPNRSKAAKETIKQLGLNVNDLIRDRNLVLDGVLSGIGELEESDIRKLIRKYKQRDKASNSCKEFCFAIVYVLNQFL